MNGGDASTNHLNLRSSPNRGRFWPDNPGSLGHVFVDDEEQRLYQTRQVGVEWRKDQKQVAQIILSYVQPTNT
jgi:hypothetical protein